MLPKLEKIPLYSNSSIAVKREISPYMDYPLHYHPEYEIIFVEKSNGIRVMGNHIGNFTDGDLMFISSNLPHVWKNDKEFYQGNSALTVDVYVIHFLEDALKAGFFDLPELNHIRKLFILGQQGVLIKGKDHQRVADLIKNVYHASGLERMLLFLRTLDAIAKAEDFVLLSSTGYTNTINSADSVRINKVMDYLIENYADEVRIEEIAKLVNLTKASFCRYFKSRTGKTCSQYLNEIRIAHACKLLVSTDLTISEICYRTGYNNISHFNRQFKLIMNSTAKVYARQYLKTL